MVEFTKTLKYKWNIELRRDWDKIVEIKNLKNGARNTQR